MDLLIKLYVNLNNIYIIGQKIFRNFTFMEQNT